MNSPKLSSVQAVQHRLKLKQAQIDTWSTREQLCLASSVLRSGDQNWVSVSRSLRPFGEPRRPEDWFSPKNSALQYASLLEKVDTPKRKRGEKGEVHTETPGEFIVRKLTTDRIEELNRLIQQEEEEYLKIKEEIAMLDAGTYDDRLKETWENIEAEQKRMEEEEEQTYQQWVKEREEKKKAIQEALLESKIKVSAPLHQRRKAPPPSGNVNRRSSSQSEPSSEAESAAESPFSEPLNVDVIGDESLESQPESKPVPTPTSPLLTSLLQSPAQSAASVQQTSNILHSAITSQRGVSGLTTATTVAVSPSLKNLVSSAIAGTTEEHSKTSTSPSTGAPTLSMLLELPPSTPGKPLPEISNIMRPPMSSATTLPTTSNTTITTPSELTAVAKVVGSDQKISASGAADTLPKVVNPEETPQESGETVDAIEHPEHQQIKMQPENESDEQVEVEVVERMDEADNANLIKMIEEAEVVTVDSLTDNDLCRTGELPAIVTVPEEVKPQPTAALSDDHNYGQKKDEEEEEEDSGTTEDTNEEAIVKEEAVDFEKTEESIPEVPSAPEPDVQTTISEPPPSVLPSKQPKQKTRSQHQARKDEDIAVQEEEEDKGEEEKEKEVEEENEPDAPEEEKVIEKEIQAENVTPEDLMIVSEPNELPTEEEINVPPDSSTEVEPLPEKEMSMEGESSNEEKAEKEDEKPSESEKDIGSPPMSPESEDEKHHGPGRPKMMSTYSAPATPTDSIPNSPSSGAPSGEDDREYKVWKKAIMLVWSRLATHKYASIFLRPITDDQAPGYHSVVFRPMDLQTIKRNIETGQIRSTVEFQRDVMLMFLNALLYNSSDHDVYKMTVVMQKECMQHIQDFVNTQMLMQVAETPKNLRRETREAAKHVPGTGFAPTPEDARKRMSTSSPQDDRHSKKRRLKED